MAQQQILGLCTYSRDAVQFACHLPFAPFAAMKTYGKPVHFILYLREQTEQGRVGLHLYSGWRKNEEQLVGAILAVFFQTSYGNVQMQLVFHHLSHGCHLADSTISYYEVG